jgi:two-component system response regulator YesN
MFNILVVDDEVWMREGLKIVIKESCPDFTVADTVHDGKEALAYLEKKQYDVVLTDIRMEEMDGIAFLREVRRRGWNIPVVIITGYDEFDYARQALRLGAIDYLLKPLDREEIKNVLQNVKDGLDKETTDDRKESTEMQGLQVVDYMKDKVNRCYMDDLAVSILADETGYNPSYLSRLFKLETGKGFIQYLTDKRMLASHQLLLETEMTVAEIAKQVGFLDDKYFIKIFKREFSSSPAEYRKMHKRESNK